MRLAAKVFWTPKAGNSEAEYEDAYWPPRDAEWNTEFFRYAVADGATQTSFSRLWARLLVRAYCKGQLHIDRLHRSLQPLQSKWQDQITTKPLPWFAQEKIRQGAFSTLLGLTFSQGNADSDLGQTWVAVAVGDSCLFQIRQNALLLPFPLRHSDDFNNSPALLSSNPASNESIGGTVFRCESRWEPGDLFFLMTDALACWFLRLYEQQADPILPLTSLESQEQFIEFIEKQRAMTDDQGRKLMRNDDVTLFKIYVC
jgi:hypothetical protein